MVNENKIISLYTDGLSLRQIQEKTQIHHLKVRKLLINRGVPRRSKSRSIALSKQRSIYISDYLRDVIEGELLGDGHLKRGKHQSCFTYGSSRNEYTKWLANVFVNEGIPICGKGVYTSRTFDKRYSKFYKKYQFATKHTIELKELRTLWYPNEIKCVPKSFRINRTNLLHWWIGDGSLNKASNYGWFETDSFTKSEVEFLSDQLVNLDIANHVHKCLVNGNDIYRIYVTRLGVLSLLNYIGHSPVNCYRYKWNCRGKNGKNRQKTN